MSEPHPKLPDAYKKHVFEPNDIHSLNINRGKHGTKWLHMTRKGLLSNIYSSKSNCE